VSTILGGERKKKKKRRSSAHVRETLANCPWRLELSNGKPRNVERKMGRAMLSITSPDYWSWDETEGAKKNL